MRMQGLFSSYRNRMQKGPPGKRRPLWTLCGHINPAGIVPILHTWRSPARGSSEKDGGRGSGEPHEPVSYSVFLKWLISL